MLENNPETLTRFLTALASTCPDLLEACARFQRNPKVLSADDAAVLLSLLGEVETIAHSCQQALWRIYLSSANEPDPTQ